MVVVVKVGGDLLKEGKINVELINDLKELCKEEKVIVVHGGGDEVTEIAEKLGKPQVFVMSPEGFKSRYTDLETAEIYLMVMSGRINKRIVKTLQEHGLNAIGISGIDGGLLRAERKKRLVIVDEKGRKRAIGGGYTGKIVSVNTKMLEDLLSLGYLPIVTPVALGLEYETLNVDGDRTAAAIAAAMKAKAIIFTTDVEGLLIDGSLVRKLTVEEAERALPKIGPGMSTKVHAAIEAVKKGVKKAIIASGFVAKPLTSALSEVSGTVIVSG